MKNKINSDLIAAQKNHDALVVSVLRSLKAAISEIALKSGNINNEVAEHDILNCIRKQIKLREDAAAAFTLGGRIELAEKEKNEIQILASFLPPGMSDEELDKIIADVIVETSASSKKDIGRVVGAVIKKVNGSADNSRIAKLVSLKL